MDKGEILAKFSAEPDKYYKVKLFEEQGYQRKACAKCGRFFWTIDANRNNCPEDSEDTYSFIGDPPTLKRFDYSQAWKEVESFFVKNGHTSVNRYPVVCRWRDDLYFTIASVVDFQRVMGSKVVFEFPANPLVVPQPCLRFKDLENVGVTGRHFSSFCMIGQLSIPDSGGYWKDECIDLDFRLLTEQFGINKKEIVFVEDVWEGGGSFGSSLEFYVRGLELGNAVFTEFQGELANHTVLDQKVIDMGAGLERFAWITMGTPTAYDCCFGPITEKLIDKVRIDLDSKILTKYFVEIAKNQTKYPNVLEAKYHAIANVGIDQKKVLQGINPLEGIYVVLDHMRTLIFAIADGALPSNVGGGYNLRIVLRRMIATLKKINLEHYPSEIILASDIIDEQIDYLSKTYPELNDYRDEIKEIIQIETERYMESKIRVKSLTNALREKGHIPNVDELITLYESNGVDPEFLLDEGVIQKIPPNFYDKLTLLHQSEKKKPIEKLPLVDVMETELLYYGDDPKEFDAKVVGAFEKFVVLDKTSFYARGGGQEPDHGSIAGFEVVDVEKHGNIVVHEIKGGLPQIGETVKCIVDSDRRDGISKHHTSTHILNSSARNVLGSWVWQNSAFKEEDHARLDITHHSALTPEEVQKIEDKANSIVQKDLPVTIENYDRGTAEKKYGFRIYQGGVVPVKSVRIVSIEDFDVEACGGTHVKKTKQIELIKIKTAKRIQDGVVRLEFVAGPAAQAYLKEHEADVAKKSADTAAKEERDELRDIRKEESREKIPALIEQITKSTGETTIDGIQVTNAEAGRFCCTMSEKYDEYFHINFGEKLIKADPKSSYCGLFDAGDTLRAIIYAGEASKNKNAGAIAKAVSEILGGSGGGNNRFAQGGGKDKSKTDEALRKAKSMVLE